MAQKVKKAKRKNIYFRQTPKEFGAERQTATFSVMNRNVPYRVYQFSKSKFDLGLQKLHNQFGKIKLKLPKTLQKEK